MPPLRSKGPAHTALVLLAFAALEVLAPGATPAGAPGEAPIRPAERRWALVIGNSAYTQLPPQAAPARGAALWAGALRGAGFEVDECLDCTRLEMEARLDRLGRRAAAGDVALLYYSGHAVGKDGVNLLFPVDAQVQECAEMQAQGLALERALGAMARARVRVAVLDVWRASLYGRCAPEAVNDLWAPSTPLAEGDLVAFATASGDPAPDDGRASVFGEILLWHAFQPGTPLARAMGAAVRPTLEASGQRMRPEIALGSAGDTFALVPVPAPVDRAEAAWGRVARMPEGPEKITALVHFLARHRDSGAPSLQAAEAYIHSDAVGSLTGALGEPPVGGPTGEVHVALPGTPGELRMIGLSEGIFDMGSPPPRPIRDGRPQKRVRVSAFAIGESEVTQEQWSAVVLAARWYGDPDAIRLDPDPSGVKRAQHPVESIRWCEAARFANALSRLEGRRPAYSIDAMCQISDKGPGDESVADGSADGYRLPTEAEWEYAARAGTTTAYPFGDDPQRICAYGNVLDETGFSASPYGEPAPCNDRAATITRVCQYTRNPWGLCDMIGNVAEWTGDFFASVYHPGELLNPIGPLELEPFRPMVRGGAYNNTVEYARSAARDPYQTYSSRAVGLRLVLPLEAVTAP